MHGYRFGRGCFRAFTSVFPWRCSGPCGRRDTTAALWHCRQRLRRGPLSSRRFFARGVLFTTCILDLSFLPPRAPAPRRSAAVLVDESCFFFSLPHPARTGSFREQA